MRTAASRRPPTAGEFPATTEALLALVGRLTPARAWSTLTERLRDPWLAPSAWQATQWEKLRALLGHCRSEVPFYRELWRRAGVDPTRFASAADLAALPVVTRQQLTEGRLAGAFPAIGRRGTQPLATSGTTSGTPFEVWIGFREYQEKYANHLRQMYLSGWRLGMRSSALHYSGHGQFRGRYSGSKDHKEAWPGLRDAVLALAHRKQVLPPYHRRETGDDALVEIWYERLSSHRPFLLDTFYVNALLLLDHARRHALPALSIPVIFVLHTLTDRERERLSRVFSADVFNRYSPHECEGIAFDCGEHRGMHAAMDSYQVEILDREGRPAPAGEVGRIVITDLENRTMPLVRYRIGDLGHWLGEDCRCGSGFPLLAGLDGREVDLLGWGSHGPATPAAVEAFLQGENRVQVHQILRRGARIDVSVVAAEAGFPDPAWIRACVTHIRNLVDDPVEVIVRAVPALRFESNGKFTFVGNARDEASADPTP